MVDDYLEGDYDSRISNDVLLYIFKDEKLVYAKNISYEEIVGGRRYEVPKTPELLGDLKFVAWAVKEGETHVGTDETLTIHRPDRNPEYIMGAAWDAQYLTHTRVAGADDAYLPHHHERYLGTAVFNGMVWDDKKNENTPVDIVLSPAPGRIVVNVEDPNNLLGDDARVVIEGSMSKMGLGNPNLGRVGRAGSGTRANVHKTLTEIPASTRAAGDLISHSTNIFGVLPSEDNADLSVHIMSGDRIVETLSITAENTGGTFRAINSGDYLEFSYRVGAAEFTITNNDWIHRIVIADM